MNSLVSNTFLFLLLLFVSSSNAMTDKATGISFAPKKSGLEIFGVGTRKKGPIKVYSVAMYCGAALKQNLASISRSKDEKGALAALRSGAKTTHTKFCLEMSFKIGAEKMASAIADSVSPRHKGSKQDVDELKKLIIAGVAEKNGVATKGTTFEFDCETTGLNVTVDGKAQGSVPSGELASAFCDVYLDENCVSPPFLTSCLENCCAP